jgi:chromosome segregation ATPase
MKRNVFRILAAIVLTLNLSLPNAASAQSTYETDFDEIDKRAYMILERDDAFLEKAYFKHIEIIAELTTQREYLNKQIALKSENENAQKAEIDALKQQLAEVTKNLTDEINSLNRKLNRRRKLHRIVTAVSFGLGVYIGFRYL